MRPAGIVRRTSLANQACSAAPTGRVAIPVRVSTCVGMALRFHLRSAMTGNIAVTEVVARFRAVTERHVWRAVTTVARRSVLSSTSAETVSSKRENSAMTVEHAEAAPRRVSRV